MGVRLDGAQRGTAGMGGALLHRQEGPTGLGACDLDPPLMAIGGRRPQGHLGGVVAVTRLVRRPLVSLRLLPLQLLLFPPDVVQQNFAVAPSSSRSFSSTRDVPVRKPVGGLLGAAGPPGGGCSSLSRRSLLGGADALQEPVGAVAVASCAGFGLARRPWVRGTGGGRGVLRARRKRRRMKGERRGKGEWKLVVGSVSLKSLRVVISGGKTAV